VAARGPADGADGVFVVVADGAGGLPGGGAAADQVVSAARTLSLDEAADFGAEDWCSFLSELDRRVHSVRDAGLTTAVLALVGPDRVRGVSVADSELWMVGPSSASEGTADQVRRPFVGSGEAKPVFFEQPYEGEAVVAGTDGFWNYASHQEIVEAVRSGRTSARELIGLARMASGTLRDDAGVVLVTPSDR